MNPEFVQMLQKMGEVERDPFFQPKKYVIVKEEVKLVNPGEHPVVSEHPDNVISDENCQIDPASDADSSGLERPVTDFHDKDGLVDGIPIVLKHPNNVISVASPTGKAPPPTLGERRVDQLLKAIKMASIMSNIGREGCSIVVYEGLYIDPFKSFKKLGMIELGWSENFSLEIVGIEKVRILNTPETIGPIFAVFKNKMQLSMTNILIYDWRKMPTFFVMPTILLFPSSKLTLSNVRVHGSPQSPIQCMKGAEAHIMDCSFSGTGNLFEIFESKSHFQRCRWSSVIGEGSVTKGAEVKIEDSFLDEVGLINVHGQGKCDLRRCDLVRTSPYKDQQLSGILAVGGGQITMEECSMKHYSSAVGVTDSHSNAIINRCSFEDCYYAVTTGMNGNAVVKNCKLFVAAVAAIRFLVHGTVRFEENSLQSTKCKNRVETNPKCAYVVTDQESKTDRVVHDFKKCRFEYEDWPEWISPSLGASRQSRLLDQPPVGWVNEYHAAATEYHAAADENEPKIEGLEDIKTCLHCKRLSLDEPGIKYKYCSTCRKVCYCSKKCQDANWKDHKLVCRRK